MIADSSSIIALIDAGDQHHNRATEAVRAMAGDPLVTTQACLTEAMHVLGRRTGFAGQDALWRMIEARDLAVLSGTDRELARAAEMMRKYRDLPMDYADATIIALAERLRTRRVFAFDTDYHVYRFADGAAVEVIP